jgi:hypothetical protein
MNSEIKPQGFVEAIIEYQNGDKRTIEFKNAVLNKGRESLAACLANEVDSVFSYYVNRMVFGDGGTSGGVTKFVNTNRNGLFGTTQASKPVISAIDPNIPSQVVFTSVISYSEANGTVLNEMALQMANGDFYSMVTFPDLNKTPQMQLTFNWRLSFV